MFLKNFLKNFGIWAEFYQNLARDDRHVCQNCIPGVDREFFWNLFLRKMSPFLVWILLEKFAKFPQINVVRVVATAFYLSKNKKTQYDEKQVCFSEKTQFSNNFGLWASSFGFLANKNTGAFSELHSTCPKKKLEEESLIWKSFSDLLWISEQKRIRLLYKKIRQGCKDGNLTVQDVNFEYQKCFWNIFWKTLVFEEIFIRFWQKTIGRIVKTAFPVSTGTFYETFFCEKKSPSFRVDLAWENCKVSADKCRQSCSNCILLVKKQKNTVRWKTSLFFRKNTIFKQFRVVSQFFWIFGQQKFGCTLRIAFYVSQKATGVRNFFLKSSFAFTLGFWAKRIRLLYKKIRQGCKDGNLNVQYVNFVYQNVFEKLSEKFSYLSRILSDFGKRRSAGLSKLNSRCRQELFMKPFLRKKSPSFSVDFAWENCKVSADRCRQSCRNCILLVKKQKNTVRWKTSLFFRKNTIFKQFRVVSQFFWIFEQQKFGCTLRIAFYVSQKATGIRNFYLKSSFAFTLDFWAKRIRLLYKKIRQGCKDGNLNVQDVNFVYQNVFEKLSEKFSYLSRILSDFGKRRSAGLSKLHSRCRQELFMKLFLRKKSPSFSVDFAWENCKVSADRCRQSCRNCILLVKKQKKTQYDEKQVCFLEKTQFSNNFVLWASCFGFLANKNPGAFSELHHFSCPKKQLEEESLIWKVFLDLVWISEQKRIRLSYKKIRQGCKDGNLNVQDVNFVWQNVFGKLSKKFRYLSRTLADIGKRRSAGLS